MTTQICGIDIGKTVFHLAALLQKMGREKEGQGADGSSQRSF